MTIGQLIFVIIISLMILNRIWYQIRYKDFPMNAYSNDGYAMFTLTCTILLILIGIVLTTLSIVVFWDIPL